MNDKSELVVVAGAGGFIGGSLVARLRARGRTRIRAVDIKPLSEWYQHFPGVENLTLDLNLKPSCERVAEGASDIYNLAANMGGMGFIESNKALCMLSVLINTHMLQAAVLHKAKRFFYASSACVYNADKQRTYEAPSLKEEDAYPALAVAIFGEGGVGIFFFEGWRFIGPLLIRVVDAGRGGVKKALCFVQDGRLEHVGVDEHGEHAERFVAFDKAHAAHVGGEIVNVAGPFGDSLATRFQIQIQGEVFDAGEVLIPLTEGLNVHSPDSRAAPRAQARYETAADESAGACDDYEFALIVHPDLHLLLTYYI